MKEELISGEDLIKEVGGLKKDYFKRGEKEREWVVRGKKKNLSEGIDNMGSYWEEIDKK